MEVRVDDLRLTSLLTEVDLSQCSSGTRFLVTCFGREPIMVSLVDPVLGTVKVQKRYGPGTWMPGSEVKIESRLLKVGLDLNASLPGDQGRQSGTCFGEVVRLELMIDYWGSVVEMMLDRSSLQLRTAFLDWHGGRLSDQQLIDIFRVSSKAVLFRFLSWLSINQNKGEISMTPQTYQVLYQAIGEELLSESELPRRAMRMSVTGPMVENLIFDLVTLGSVNE